MTNHDLQLRSGGNVTHVIVKADGKVGVGTSAPGARLDVNGRIMRGGQDFSFAGIVKNGATVNAPWGSITDWNIIVSPQSMGRTEPGSEGDNALLMFQCYAIPNSGNSWFVLAQYKYRENEGLNGAWEDGFANWLLEPKPASLPNASQSARALEEV
jgi:hypothetical protein